MAALSLQPRERSSCPRGSEREPVSGRAVGPLVPARTAELVSASRPDRCLKTNVLYACEGPFTLVGQDSAAGVSHGGALKLSEAP